MKQLMLVLACLSMVLVGCADDSGSPSSAKVSSYGK